MNIPIVVYFIISNLFVAVQDLKIQSPKAEKILTKGEVNALVFGARNDDGNIPVMKSKSVSYLGENVSQITAKEEGSKISTESFFTEKEVCKTLCFLPRDRIVIFQEKNDPRTPETEYFHIYEYDDAGRIVETYDVHIYFYESPRGIAVTSGANGKFTERYNALQVGGTYEQVITALGWRVPYYRLDRSGSMLVSITYRMDRVEAMFFFEAETGELLKKEYDTIIDSDPCMAPTIECIIHE